MPNYHLNQEVNWRKILRIQRWHLEMRERDYERLSPIVADPIIQDELKTELLENLKIYQSLRKFLGYYKITKMEREILTILKPGIQ